MSTAMTHHQLQQYIDENGVAAELVHLPGDAPTVQAAADLLGVGPERIVKSVLLLADGCPVLVVANGLARIDVKRVARQRGVGKKKVKLASPDDTLKFTGYPAGGVPPFGHRQAIDCLIEPEVLNLDTVYGGGGEAEWVVRVAPDEIRRVTGAAELAMAEPVR